MYFCIKRQNLIERRKDSGDEGSWHDEETSESQDGELQPITGLCVFTQTQNEANINHPFPPKFIPIIKSITNTFDANLNPDSRYSVYLAYTRSQRIPFSFLLPSIQLLTRIIKRTKANNESSGFQQNAGELFTGKLLHGQSDP